MLIARHYVRIGARVYAGGEVIEDSIPGKDRDWLLKAGAVIETAPLPPDDGIREEQPEDPVIQDAEPETETDAPEIDAMAGIVGSSEEPPKKAAKGRRKGGSK